MEESKFMYCLAALTVVFLAILQAGWMVVRVLLSGLFHFVAFLTVGMLFGAVIGGHHHHHD